MAYQAHDRARWVSEDPVTKRADRDDFARDRARLVHSAALRRLSAKTQVVDPGSNDFVRNRLTHSLEVAQIGREFGAALGCNADVVDTACLAHDLGHPPFGHNGERALDELSSDIGGFEGNAQTLRILTRLEPKRFHSDGRSAGLNLTRASLDASVKYPWPRPPGGTGTKFGTYADDMTVFDWIRDGAPEQQRCLEAQVMDWSDDVAYSVHDVEDAIASGRIDLASLGRGDGLAGALAVASDRYAPDATPDQLAPAWDRLLATGLVPPTFGGTRADLAALKDMTSGLIGRFVYRVEQATRAVYGEAPLSRYQASLVIPVELFHEVALLKGLAGHFVMDVAERVERHTEQRDIIAALVAAFQERPQERLDEELRADWAAARDDAAARRVIIDQVASLTDVRALELAREWA